MNDNDFFRRLVQILDAAGIAYMVTGSYASALHGTPRATQDVDVVVAPTPDQLRRLAAELPADDYYFNLAAALDALARRAQFNAIDYATGWKIDFIVRKDRPFSVAEFDRRVLRELNGQRLFLATAEDVVVAKLEWAKKGSSERQIGDVAGILRVRSDLDRDYVRRWVAELGLETQWAAAGGD